MGVVLVLVWCVQLKDQVGHMMDEAIKQQEEANPDAQHLTPQQRKQLAETFTYVNVPTHTHTDTQRERDSSKHFSLCG